MTASELFARQYERFCKARSERPDASFASLVDYACTPYRPTDQQLAVLRQHFDATKKPPPQKKAVRP